MMKKYILLLLLGFSLHLSAKETMKTDTLSFVFEGKKLTGLLDQPDNKKPAGLILLIPGSGSTNMVEGNGYYKRLRQFFVEEGFACYVWDKPGCGKSEGAFDDMLMQKSAQEAIAAITELKRLNIPGADNIGLWGLSRGGWICPLIIADYPSIAFWISVSGPDDKDNFPYLLEKNWIIEGKSKAEAGRLKKEWLSNADIARHGGTFEQNIKATENVRKDSFYIFIAKPSKPTLEGYLRWQKGFETGETLPIDEATGLAIYFPDFDKVLNKVNCPVLAIFGEKDSQVNWQKTKVLYQNTIGKDPGTTLTIKTFPDGNHNLFKCKTGGFREKLDKVEFCDGYFETMSAWLKRLKENSNSLENNR